MVIDISRSDHPDLYSSMVEIFNDALPSWLSSSLKSDSPTDRRSIDKIPSPEFNNRIEALRELLDGVIPSDLRYPWSMIRAHLRACHMYISWPTISIRPVIPPALTHDPFANASQRIYMSATLGDGGELERITGVRSIERIPAPEGWDSQGTGRRFILFPDMSLPTQTADHAMARIIDQSARTLILTPDRITAEKVTGLVEAECHDLEIISSGDIETSLDPFLESDHGALVLQARYDGLDLPDDACHLEIIYGLPGATNSQERFLLHRIGAVTVLRDRIRTRLAQGLGRCTRSATDHAVVLITGEGSLDFCLKAENLSGFHPELQAELEYGQEASKVDFPDELIDVALKFMEKAEGWEDVDEWIRERRDSISRIPDPNASALLTIASHEVDYTYAMWKEDFETALEKARICADALSGNEHRPYRSWWYYLAGSAAWLSADQTGDEQMATVSRDMFRRAASATLSVTWFLNLANNSLLMEKIDSPADEFAANAVEGIEAQLLQAGVVGERFEKDIQAFLELIDNDDARQFENGLRTLGNWFGFDASRPGGQGDPDGIWRLADLLIVAFEAKTEESSEGPISVRTAREAQGHLNWVNSNLDLASDSEVIGVVISSRSTIAKKALPHCENLYLVNTSEVRQWSRDITDLVRGLRARATQESSGALRDMILERLTETGLDPKRLLGSLKGKPLSDLSLA